MRHEFQCECCGNRFYSVHKVRKYCSKLCYQRQMKYCSMKRSRDDMFWKLIKAAWYIGVISLVLITGGMYVRLKTLQHYSCNVQRGNYSQRGIYGDKKIIQKPNQHKNRTNKPVHARRFVPAPRPAHT